MSAIGISVGGTATAISTVAAFSGPLAPAVAIAAGLALLGMVLFGESWQARLSRKLSEHLAEKKVADAFALQVRKFWSDTKTAFDAGADGLEAQYRRTVADLASVAEGAVKKEEAEGKIRRYEEARDFFVGIPWVKAGRPRDEKVN